MDTFGKILILACAFAPAAFLLVMRIYLKSHPPITSEVGVRRLQRGLTLGVISATALPLLVILFNFRPASLSYTTYEISALAGNVLNLLAIGICLRVRSGESIFTALFLFGIQWAWLGCTFYVLRLWE